MDDNKRMSAGGTHREVRVMDTSSMASVALGVGVQTEAGR
jgi:hypothetical protein